MTRPPLRSAPWPGVRTPLWVLVGACLCSGCAHLAGQGSGVENVPLTGCEHPSGWSDQAREAAVSTYLYAQLAANVYADDTTVAPYRLAESVTLDSMVYRPRTGFAAGVYTVHPSPDSSYRVIAYRGTNFWQWRDWWFGNLRTVQNRQGEALFDSVRARLGAEAIIAVTGHSLGGGIAYHVSHRRDRAPAFVFNASPRYTGRQPGAGNTLQSVAEYAEVLRVIRGAARFPDQTHTIIRCTGGSPFRKHTMTHLATCLTGSASVHDERARASLVRNGQALTPPSAPRCTNG